MWTLPKLQDEAGQAASESALLIAALCLGAAGLGWPLFSRVFEAWTAHEAMLQAVIDRPLP